MILWLLCSVILVLLSIFLYKKGTANADYFTQRGIPNLKPSFLFGNTGDLLRRKKTMMDFVKDMYDAFPDKR